MDGAFTASATVFYVDASHGLEANDIVKIDDFRCKICCSIALPYTDDHKPIIMETDEVFEEKSKELISALHNLIQIPKGE